MKVRILLLLAALVATGNLVAQSRLTYERVMIPSGKAELEGLLVRPAGNPARLPAIIWLGGSGSWDMITNYEQDTGALHKYYLEAPLAEQGVAFLYLNKRGMGRSTGHWRRQNFYGRANDANAAYAWLKARADVDTSRIALAGHSQGGWIAQLAAVENPGIDFVLSFAGPTLDVYTQTMQTTENYAYQCDSLRDQRLLRRLRWRRRELSLGGFIGSIVPVGEAGYWARIRNYNTDEVLRQLKQPALFLFSSHDPMVPPAENLAHLREVFPGGVPGNMKTYTLEGADHSFRLTHSFCRSWQEAQAYPYSPDMREVILNWMGQYWPEAVAAKGEGLGAKGKGKS